MDQDVPRNPDSIAEEIAYLLKWVRHHGKEADDTQGVVLTIYKLVSGWNPGPRPEEAFAIAGSEREALQQIAAPTYGLQSIMEDYPDHNAYNYHAMKYWSRLAIGYQTTARYALSASQKQEGEQR